MYRYFLQDNYSNVRIGFEENNKMQYPSTVPNPWI